MSSVLHEVVALKSGIPIGPFLVHKNIFPDLFSLRLPVKKLIITNCYFGLVAELVNVNTISHF